MIGVILAQVFGFVALVLICFSYFCKNKSIFNILQTFADIFYGGAYFFVNSYVAGFITLVSALRCAYLFFAEKYDFKYTYHFISIFILGYIAMTIAFWQSWTDIIPLITSILFTIAYAIKDLQKLRYVSLIPNIILVGFNIFSFTFVSALLDFIEVLIIITAIVKNRSRNVSNKKLTNL